MVPGDANLLNDSMQILARESAALVQRDPQLSNCALMSLLRSRHPGEFAIVFEGEQHGAGDCHVV